MKSGIRNAIRGLIASAALTGAVQAQNHGWASATLKNNYVASGSTMVDSPVIQTDVGVNLPKGMTFDVWSDYIINERRHNEHDLTLSFPIKDSDKISLTGNVGYWALPRSSFDNIKVAKVSLGTKLPLNPRFSALYGNSRDVSGFTFDVVGGRDFKITDNLSARLEVEAGANSKFFTDKTGLSYLGASGSLSYTKGKMSANAGLRSQKAVDSFKRFGFENKETVFFGLNYNF